MSSKSKEFLSSSDSDSDEPQPKKKRAEKPEKAAAKPEKAAAKPEKEKDEPTKGPGGEYMFQLAKMRFATVSEFRGNVMVGIREYYEKDGKLLPGKKGISLSKEQWQALKNHIDDIDETVKNF